MWCQRVTCPPPTLRLPSCHRWTMTCAGTRSPQGEATKCLTSLLRRAGRSCCERVSLGRRRTPKLCRSASSACWWRRSSGWLGPSPQTRPSSKSRDTLCKTPRVPWSHLDYPSGLRCIGGKTVLCRKVGNVPVNNEKRRYCVTDWGGWTSVVLSQSGVVSERCEMVHVV